MCSKKRIVTSEINFESSRSLIRLFRDEMRVRKKYMVWTKQFVSIFHGINEKINLLLLNSKLLIETKPIQTNQFEILFLNILYIFEIFESNNRNTFKLGWWFTEKSPQNLHEKLFQLIVGSIEQNKNKFEIEETRHNFLQVQSSPSRRKLVLQVIKFNNLLATIVKFSAVNIFPTSIIIK